MGFKREVVGRWGLKWWFLVSYGGIQGAEDGGFSGESGGE